MKSKLVVGFLVIALLLCQGLAFAEKAKDVTAVAEDVVVAENPAPSAAAEAVVADESASGAVKEAVATDELVAPATEPVKNAVEEAKESPAEEAKETKEAKM